MKTSFEYLTEFAEPDDFHRWEEVDLEIIDFTDLGMKVAINGEFAGLVYADQIYDRYIEGQKIKGYITAIREDGRIDVSLQPDKGRHVHSTSDKILQYLKKDKETFLPGEYPYYKGLIFKQENKNKFNNTVIYSITLFVMIKSF